MPTLAKPRSRSRPTRASWASEYELCLYVADRAPRSVLALTNLRQLCATHLAGRHHLEVVDVHAHPERAVRDRIVAAPAVVRYLPKPLRTVIGTLADPARVLLGLDIRPVEEP